MARPLTSRTPCSEPRWSLRNQYVPGDEPPVTFFATTPTPSIEMYFVTTPFVIS